MDCGAILGAYVGHSWSLYRTCGGLIGIRVETEDPGSENERRAVGMGRIHPGLPATTVQRPNGETSYSN